MRLEWLSRQLLARLRDAPGLRVILMYHGTPVGDPHSHYSLRADRFESHADVFTLLGWPAVRVADLLTPAPGARLALSFDDGYQDNWTGAFEPLKARGLLASWYVVSGRLGGQADWAGPGPDEAALLSVEALRTMAASGMEIGSHSQSHADLTTLEPDALHREVGDSKQRLEALLGHPVQGFAYPFGRQGAAARTAVRAAGYRYALGTRSGRLQASDDTYDLRRITLYRDDDADSLIRKLWLGANRASRGAILRARLPAALDRWLRVAGL